MNIETLIKDRIVKYKNRANAAVEFHDVEKLLALSYAFEELLDEVRKENSKTK